MPVLLFRSHYGRCPPHEWSQPGPSRLNFWNWGNSIYVWMALCFSEHFHVYYLPCKEPGRQVVWGVVWSHFWSLGDQDSGLLSGRSGPTAQGLCGGIPGCLPLCQLSLNSLRRRQHQSGSGQRIILLNHSPYHDLAQWLLVSLL